MCTTSHLINVFLPEALPKDTKMPLLARESIEMSMVALPIPSTTHLTPSPLVISMTFFVMSTLRFRFRV